MIGIHLCSENQSCKLINTFNCGDIMVSIGSFIAGGWYLYLVNFLLPWLLPAQVSLWGRSREDWRLRVEIRISTASWHISTSQPTAQLTPHTAHIYYGEDNIYIRDLKRLNFNFTVNMTNVISRIEKFSVLFFSLMIKLLFNILLSACHVAKAYSGNSFTESWMNSDIRNRLLTHQ